MDYQRVRINLLTALAWRAAAASLFSVAAQAAQLKYLSSLRDAMNPDAVAAKAK